MKKLVFSLILSICLSVVYGQTAEDLIQKGFEYAYDGNYALAIKTYDKAIALNPNLAKAYYNRGNVKYDLQDYKGAIADCEKAIALNPDFKDAYFNLAISKYHLKDYRSALNDFDQALRMNPQDSESYRWRGMSKFKLGNTVAACIDWTQAKALGNAYVNDFLHKYCEEESSIESGQ